MSLQTLFGLATGIGSMPHHVPGEALELIFTYLKRVPHWPQLPRRSTSEGFAAQYLAPLIEREIVAAHSNGTLCFSTEHPAWENRCLQFYEMMVDGADRAGGDDFAFPPDSAAGFYAMLEASGFIPPQAVCLKGQISGPVTVGFQVNDSGGRPSFYNDILRELLVKCLSGQAAWQSRMLQSTGLPSLVFIDDPGLYSYGSSSAVGLGRREIQESLREVITGIRSAGGLAGAHCCAGADWSLLLELPLDLVSFDAYGFFPSMQVYSEALERFLQGGGALAWGIVPTGEDVLREDTASLQQLLEAKMEALVKQGVNESRLRRQFMITPACGTGTLPLTLVERIYRLTASLVDRVS